LRNYEDVKLIAVGIEKRGIKIRKYLEVGKEGGL